MMGRFDDAGEEILRERNVDPFLLIVRIGLPVSTLSMPTTSPTFSSSLVELPTRPDAFFPFFPPNERRSKTGDNMLSVRILLPLNDVVRSLLGETGGRMDMARERCVVVMKKK